MIALALFRVMYNVGNVLEAWRGRIRMAEEPDLSPWKPIHADEEEARDA